MELEGHIFHGSPLVEPILNQLNTVLTLTNYSSLILILAYSILYVHMSEMAFYHVPTTFL